MGQLNTWKGQKQNGQSAGKRKTWRETERKIERKKERETGWISHAKR
jgi:hypothetical protein